jgi:hypothetical protein
MQHERDMGRLDSSDGAPTFRSMRTPPTKKAIAAKLRNWRVTILRNRAELLGVVQAADERAAEKAAAKAFALDDDRRKRLAVREE